MEIPKEEEKVAEVVVNEEAELDSAIEASIASVKAGNALEQKAPASPEVKKEETPIEPKKEEEPSEPQIPVEEPKDTEFRIPNKGKFESDESYEKRIELMDLVKRKKAAKTEEQKQVISDEIKKTKGQLKNLNGADKIINPLNEKVVIDTKKEEEDDALKADRERLRQLGGATTEDIQKIIQSERLATETKNTLARFVDRHAELKDDDTREVFFDFVDQNFNWEGKSPKEMMTVLELARESMFKPSETIQERVLKGANVQEKVNVMQFPGGTVAKQNYSPEMQKSIDELKATGISEEKALELISE